MSEYGMNQQGYSVQPPKKKKSNAPLIVLLVIISLVLVVGFATFVIIIAFALSTKTVSGPEYTGHDGYVAVIYVDDVISTSSESSLFASSSYNHSYTISTVIDLMDDQDNIGILLCINTPGGSVYATDELYLILQEYREYTGRPVYSYCMEMAASGGYYLAAGTDKIIMNRNCTTGSIGVTAGTHIDISGFLEKQGITATQIHVGDNKAIGDMMAPFTDEHMEIYQSVLQETYDQFVDIIVEGRQLKREDVIAMADGRIFSPKQALGNGLIDEIGTYAEACNIFIEDRGWTYDVEFLHYQPDDQMSFSDLLLQASGIRKSSTLDTYLSYVEKPFEGIGYYFDAI